MDKRRFLSFRNDLAKLNEMVKNKIGMRVCGIALEKPLSGNFSYLLKIKALCPDDRPLSYCQFEL